MKFRYKVLDDSICYTGRELRSGWVREKSGLKGDAAVAFFGPCMVATDDLVDMEDAQKGERIESALMAHIIIEHPGCSLETAVLRQRLLICLLHELLQVKGLDVKREGDDLFSKARKLTVSIAAPSPHSCLIHTGINIRPEGAPVPAVGLDEIGVDASKLVGELLELYAKELESCKYAEGKVRGVS